MILSLVVAALIAQQALTVHTASDHPMQYYESLPDGWTPGKRYPVIVVIESADRDFEKNAQEFVTSRGKRPYIIVAPIVLTNGGSRVKDNPTYHYSKETWEKIDRDGPWRFDEDGLRSVLSDVAKEGGSGPAYWTAWEAGCHTLFAVSFNRPEWVKAAALVAPNYQSRWVKFSDAVPKPALKIFAGGEDPAWAPGKPLYDQTEEAKRAAAEHGFKDISTIVVPGKGHGALADDVVKYFDDLEKTH